MTPEEIMEAYDVLAGEVSNDMAQRAQAVGNSQRSIGGLAEVVANPSGQTSGLANYTYNRLLRPTVDTLTTNLITTGKSQGMDRYLKDELMKAKNAYEDAKNAYTVASTTPKSGGGNDGYREQTDDEYTGKEVEEPKTNSGTTTSKVTIKSHGSRGIITTKKVEVTKDSNGNVSVLKIDGVPHYGREARAKYRYLQQQGKIK